MILDFASSRIFAVGRSGGEVDVEDPSSGR